MAALGVSHSASPFARAAPELIALGYNPLPIKPGEKRPGEYRGGVWQGMSQWERFRDRQPSQFELSLWMRNYPEANVGIVLGSEAVSADGEVLHVIAVDIDCPDHDDFEAVFRALPHSPMRKRGAKGETLFYLAAKSIRSRPYSRQTDRVRLVDVLTGFDARQTVCPPSAHPSGMAYAWTAGPCAAAELPAFTAEDLEKLEETLTGLGWDPDAERATPIPTSAPAAIPDEDDFFGETKRSALERLDAWVPALDLYGCRRARGGYEAVATWRPSGTGKPVEQRKRNLSIQANGITDFGDGPRGYSAIDLVMAAHGLEQAAATSWLRGQLGLGDDTVTIALEPRVQTVEVVDPSTGAVIDVDPLARPYIWRDPTSIPTRQFLYGRHFIRQFVSCTFAPGGVGKSALGLAEAACMASGYSLLGVPLAARLRVWVWSGEDPIEETERRLAAICLRYGLSRGDLEGYLYLGSGRETDLVMAKQEPRTGTTIYAPDVDRVISAMQRYGIDVALIDPFVSTHRVMENDNNAIDLVAKTWAKIAGATESAIDLVHHTRKTGGADATVEDGRGATALLNAARSARVLNTMTQEEANKYGIKSRRSYFRVDNGKANLAPPPEGADWFRFEGVLLGNGGLEGGDNVGVVTTWEPEPQGFEVEPDKLAIIRERLALEGWRDDPRSSEWVGYLLAEVLGMDPSDEDDRARIKTRLGTWKKDGWLAIDNHLDASRRKRAFVIAGKNFAV